MRVSICSRLIGFQDLLLEANPADSTLRQNRRRYTRTATLDGGVAITDGGWSDGDRTLTLALHPRQLTPETLAAIDALRASSPRVTVATDEGVFEALLERYSLGANPSLSFALIAKLSP